MESSQNGSSPDHKCEAMRLLEEVMGEPHHVTVGEDFLSTQNTDPKEEETMGLHLTKHLPVGRKQGEGGGEASACRTDTRPTHKSTIK